MCKIQLLVLSTLVVTIIGCCQVKGIEGVWEICEISTNQGLITDKPAPGIFIFTADHYSMIWLLSTKPGQRFAELWNPTDEEKIKRFNSMIVNSGTYEIDGDTLTLHPIVARMPEIIGGKQISEYRVESDSMWLKFVDEYSYDGVQAPWVATGWLAVKLIRME